MRILLAGGSGVIGSRLIPLLRERGHDVVATTRRPDRLGRIAELGATGAVVDVYDAERLAEVVAGARPDLVLHQLTDLAEYDLAANARIRREGTANLVAAASRAGTRRMIVQSIAWVFGDGATAATEADPITPGSAVDDMESLVRRMPRASVLRYGRFYGPTTWYAVDGRTADAVRNGAVTATRAISSFVHVDDAAAATVQAVDWPDGTYHIVDDEPAPATVWLPVYAAGLGAPPPPVDEQAPATGRPVANALARSLGWVPRYPSWRQGFPSTGEDPDDHRRPGDPDQGAGPP